MTFEQTLDAAIDVLQRRGRVTQRALKRQLEVDDEYLDDIVHELVEGQRLAREEGVVLVWSGPSAPSATPKQSYTPAHLEAEVLGSASALVGEHKQVTVVFCDLANSTALADRIGAEPMHGLLNDFFEIALETIHSFQGTVNQFLGDGFMALFGAPVSYEDHARFAVRAAVALQQRLCAAHDRLGGPHGTECQFRIGVNAGKVVVGGIGDNLRRDYTAVGDTSNVAARLQSLAQPGEILISESVFAYVEDDAELEALPPTKVKGKDEPIQVYRVLGIHAKAAPIDSRMAHTPSPFVGRDREMSLLQDAIGSLGQGQGRAVAIVAQAGMGKSRLLFEVRCSMQDRPARLLEAKCVSFEHALPYRPVAELWAQVAGIEEFDSSVQITTKLRASLVALELPPEEWLPYLLHLFDIRVGAEALDQVSPVAVQNRTFELVREMVRRQSRRRPLILLVEDLHWIERTSEACFASLLEVSLDAPVVLIFTYRPNYDADWLAGDAVLKIPLQALEPDDSLQVVRANTRGAQLSATMERTILAKAEGVPFFLEELTRAMLESQELGDDVEVPATIEGVITSRIDRLQEPTKQLLMTAAVLGRVFHRSLIREIWHRAERIDPLLNELVRMEFVVSQPGGGELAYMFRHALIQEVAYGCLLTKVRREIHALAGAALERLYAEHLDDVCDRLAHHYAHTQKSDKAVEYLYRFGEKAAHAYSHLEAISAFEQALTKAHPLEPADLRDHWILKIALKLARSFTFLGRFPDIVELLTQHGERVERVANDRLGGQYYFWLGHTYSYRGQQALAAENAQRAMTLASRCGDPATAGRAAYVLERSSFWLGSFPEAIHYSKQAVTLLEEAGERWWLGQARWMSGWAYGAMGSFDEALHAEEQTHLIGQEIRDPRLPCYAAWTKAVMLACRGDYEEAVASGRMGIERSPDPLNTGVAWGFTGFACLEAGDLDEAAMLLEIGAEQMEKMGFRPLFGWFSTWGGEACLGRGDLAQGRELALRGKEVCEAAHNPWGVGLAQRALGRCALAEDDLNGAQEHLEGALSTFTAIRSRYFAARVHVELGKIARQRDDREAATEHLKIAQGVFGELRCTPHLQKVRRMARAYGVSLDDGSPGGRPTLSSNSR